MRIIGYKFYKNLKQKLKYIIDVYLDIISKIFTSLIDNIHKLVICSSKEHNFTLDEILYWIIVLLVIQSVSNNLYFLNLLFRQRCCLLYT